MLKPRRDLQGCKQFTVEKGYIFKNTKTKLGSLKLLWGASPKACWVIHPPNNNTPTPNVFSKHEHQSWKMFLHLSANKAIYFRAYPKYLKLEVNNPQVVVGQKSYILFFFLSSTVCLKNRIFWGRYFFLSYLVGSTHQDIQSGLGNSWVSPHLPCAVSYTKLQKAAWPKTNPWIHAIMIPL